MGGGGFVGTLGIWWCVRAVQDRASLSTARISSFF